MKIITNNNYYVNACRNYINNFDELDYPNDSIQFSYGEVNYDQFLTHYSSEGWENRKIEAIPQAFYCGVILNLYRIGMAILYGIKEGLYGENKLLFKAQFHYMGRNLEEAAARIISIFWDSFALFLIQESQYNQNCYDLVLNYREESHPGLVPKETIIKEPIAAANEETIPKATFSQMMVRTFDTIWKHANHTEKAEIQQLLSLIFKNEDIESWEEIEEGKYRLKLNKIKIGTTLKNEKLTIEKEMILTFSESQIGTTGRYNKNISFSNKAVKCTKKKIVQISAYLQELSFEKENDKESQVTSEFKYFSHTHSMTKALNKWKTMVWEN